jgi:hypothetical protein
MLGIPRLLLSLALVRAACAAICTLNPLGEGLDDTDQVLLFLMGSSKLTILR